MRKIRNEAFRDSTLYFLVFLGSLLDDFVRDERITSDVRRDIYIFLKEDAIKNFLLAEFPNLPLVGTCSSYSFPSPYYILCLDFSSASAFLYSSKSILPVEYAFTIIFIASPNPCVWDISVSYCTYYS